LRAKPGGQEQFRGLRNMQLNLQITLAYATSHVAQLLPHTLQSWP